MLGLELVVVLGIAVLAGSLAARRTGVAPPVLLLAGGALLGLIPGLRGVELPPEMVLLLFLPALLFWESLTTSLREICRDLRGVVLMSTVLVFLTAWAVAAVAHALGLPWGPAWVLGAAVAPTDATAVAVLARALPRRNVTLLRAESLVNDGTALVLYGLAVGVTVGDEQFSLPYISWLFLLSYGGGTLIGAAVAWIGDRVRRLVDDPILENVVMILIPFTAYLLAELVEASGVLAVVVCGLIISQIGPRTGAADFRMQLVMFWSLATFVLNGALFVLVGLELWSAAGNLTSAGLTDALISVAVISAVVIAVRFVFLYGSGWFFGVIDRRWSHWQRSLGNRVRVVHGLAGFRGAVSLAAALGVPLLLDSGKAFPARDMIIFVTSGVIVVTLAQALLLPRAIRWARMPPDTSTDEELRLARTRATEEALAALPALAAELGTDPAVADELRREFEEHLDHDKPAVQHKQHESALRLALLAQKRATVLRLRDEDKIDDTVLRRIVTALDFEEARLSRREVLD